MRLLSITAVLLINLFIAVRYTVLIRLGTIKPALAMWTFFSIAVGGSLATYLFNGDFSLLSSKGTLATVYAARAIVSTSLLLVLMARAEWKSRRDRPGLGT